MHRSRKLIEEKRRLTYYRCFTQHAVYPNAWLQRWERGFCTAIRYSGECSLELADQLLWRPSHGPTCPDCRGTGDETSDGQGTCGKCRGKGRLPVPCPPTAQPIDTVVLTGLVSMGNERMLELADKHRYDWLPTETGPGQPNAWRFMSQIFRLEWPWVTFIIEAPPA